MKQDNYWYFIYCLCVAVVRAQISFDTSTKIAAGAGPRISNLPNRWPERGYRLPLLPLKLLNMAKTERITMNVAALGATQPSVARTGTNNSRCIISLSFCGNRLAAYASLL